MKDKLITRLPELEDGNIRIRFSQSAYKRVSPEKLMEWNRMLRGNRTDKRRAIRELTRAGGTVLEVKGEQIASEQLS